MKFKLNTASHSIPEIPSKFNLSSEPVPENEEDPVYRHPENKYWFIEVNLLEDLIELSKELGERVILDADPDICGNMYLTIYDDYLE